MLWVMKIAVAGGTGVVGRVVSEVAGRQGHEVVVLARSKGVDVTSADGLAEHLEGVDAVIDVTSIQTMSARASRDFFRRVTGSLLVAGARAGVGHHVALSILGAAAIDAGYHAGKALQEDLVAKQPTGTFVRAAQFHDFGRQTLERTTLGPVALVPRIRSQPVSTTDVAELLLEVAAGPPLGHGPSIAGPQEIRVAEMARRYLEVRGEGTRVVEWPMPGALGRGMRSELLLAERDSRIGARTYDEWLATPRV